MFKYLSLFVFLAGCGAPQTPDEVKADNLLHEFVADCKKIHGDRCSQSMAVHSLSDSVNEQSCWTEDGNPIRSVVLYRGTVAQGNKAAVYQQLFECSLTLGSEEPRLNFNEFALSLNLVY